MGSENLKKADLDNFVPKTISDILKKVSLISDYSNKSRELDLFVSSLEDEMRKVDAFKRELPLCMQLLKDGIEKLKEEKLECEGRESRPIMMEELMMAGGESNSNSSGAKMSNEFIIDEKRNWMSSVQLWSTPIQYEHHTFDDTLNQDSSFLSLKSRYEEEEVNKKGIFKNRGGGAFSPFKRPSGGVTFREYDERVVRESRGGGVDRPAQRKQRRCWSPELHRVFVDALDNLGGAEVATPKQIREQMKVEGLTNDEVKSHLQKYRIHIRRIASASSPGPAAAGFPWFRQPQMAANSGSSSRD